MRELIIKKNDAGQRLDKFITKTLDLPPSLLYKSIRLKKIKVNRKRAEGNQMLMEGDTVQCFLAEEFFEKQITENSLSSITPHLNIIFEDENLMLLNKRPGISVHEDEQGTKNTLITHIQAYLFAKGEYNPEDEQSFAPALCNRIDRNTGGIVICAKTAEALRCINDLIKNREIKKKYLALVHGIPSNKSGKISNWLLKNPDTNTVSVYHSPHRGALEAHSLYRVLKSSRERDMSLVEVELLTGRTHQIRAQFADMGHPLVGDGKYGINRDDKKIGFKFQALYSYKLTFMPKDELSPLAYLKGREFSVKEVFFKDEI